MGEIHFCDSMVKMSEVTKNRHTVVGYVYRTRVSVPERRDVQVGWDMKRLRMTHEDDGVHSPVTFLTPREP
jgi:hypothetical protein